MLGAILKDMKFTFIILLSLLTNILVCQDKTNVEMAVSKFLSGDIKESNIYFSKAIQADTLLFENYYLRGVNRLYLNDTIGAIADFKKAANLKRWQHKVCTDSLTNAIMANRPVDSSKNISNQYSLDSKLYNIQLATWLFLKKDKISLSCKMYRQLVKQGLKNVKTLIGEVCVCC